MRTRAAVVEALCALGLVVFCAGFPLWIFAVGTSR